MNIIYFYLFTDDDHSNCNNGIAHGANFMTYIIINMDE